MLNTRFALIIAMAVFAAFAAVLGEAGNPSVVAPLKNQEIADGCGCYFARSGAQTQRSDQYIFEFEHRGAAWMNIRGQDTKLQPSDPESMCMLNRIGQRCIMWFKSDDLQVKISVGATWVCPDEPSAESCEVTKLAGTLKVQLAHTKESLSIEGECGC